MNLNFCRFWPQLFLGLYLAVAVPCQAGSLSAASARGEPLGPSNRRSPLVISELMVRPLPNADGQYLQFVELYNSQLWPEDLSGYRLGGSIEFLFPAGTVMAAESFLVVAKNPEGMQSTYAITNIFGPYDHALSPAGGTVELRNRSGALLWQCAYSTSSPWPVSAYGSGHSLVLRSPSYGESSPRAWAQSARIGGSPGRAEPSESQPLDAIILNEWRTEGSPGDYLELYNHSSSTLDLAGCVITDDPQTPKFLVPAGTTIPPAGFLHFSFGALGFQPDPHGAIVYLYDPGQTRVLDAVRADPHPAGLTNGRFPDGSDFFRGLTGPTPGASNQPARPGEVLINEIHYKPISGKSDEDYVELYNRGNAPVSLDGWRLSGGIRFEFTAGTTIGPSDYLVIAKRAASVLSKYPFLNSTKVIGDYNGTLSGSGDRVVLSRPRVLSIHDSQTIGSVAHVAEDEVNYATGGRWSPWADGGGSSLELINPSGNHDLPSSWQGSDETAKSPWVSFEATGRVDLTSPNYPADSLQILLMGEGECLVDDLEVFTSGGTNRVVNARFEKGIEGFVPQGSHVQSSWEPPGPLSDGALHVRSTHRGDTGANRIRTRLTSAVARNSLVTIRGRARWLKGFPEVLLRLRGNGLEAIGSLPLPASPGSPGSPNPGQLNAPRPGFYQTTHTPPVPASGQAVVVTTGLDNPGNRPLVVNLRYRIDPGTNFTDLVMNDSGADGDAVPGDRIYTATIPGQATATLVAFHVQAAEPGAAIGATFPTDAPGRECLVRFGDSQVPGRFATYRLWMTQSNVASWGNRNRPKLSNEPLDGTFIYGNSRIIYNIGAYYSGSPFHSPTYTTPTGALCNYAFRFPEDDSFLGSTQLKLTSPGNNPGDDDTAQREQTAYWMAAQLNLPYNYQRNFHLVLNGVRRGKIFEDTQNPSEDVIEEWFSEAPDGDLYKIAGWFEFDDAASQMETTWATLGRFLNNGAKKVARYRWNFQKRAADLSTSNYTNLFQLVDAANTTGDGYQAAVESLVDVDQWMRIFALEHVVGNWDSWGNNNGQNMYAYKPPNGRWQLFIWDLDIVLGLGGYSDGPSSSLFQVTDQTVDRMYKYPAFRRIYWQAMVDLLNLALDPSKVNPLLDARYNAFTKNGASVTSPSGIKSFIGSRRTYLLNQLKTVNVPFDIQTRSGADFQTDQAEEVITGSAPIELRTLKFNGVEYPLKWTTVSNWSVRIPLHSGNNLVRIQGFDRTGRLLPDATDTLNIISTSSSQGTNNHLLINEWMASNTLTLTDPLDDKFKDWLELFNPASVTVDLSGFTLDMGPASATRFRFPDGTSLAGHSYLLLWADGENPPVHPFHLPFKLSQGGGQVVLSNPNGGVVDSVVYGPQISDLSEGRSPAVRELIGQMRIPTPGAENLLEEVPTAVPVLVGRADRDVVELGWSTQPGKTYHLQFKDDLNETAWRNLPGDVLALDTFTTKTHAIGRSQGKRFYRVQQVD